MSRRNGNREGLLGKLGWTQEEALAIEQGLDMQMLEHCKTLLTSLWKQGRISMDTSWTGQIALSLAIDAVQNPSQTARPWNDGPRLVTEQRTSVRGGQDHEF